MLSTSAIGALTHGWPGLVAAFTAVEAPMLAGLLRARARISQVLLSPIIAGPLTGVIGIGMAAGAPIARALGAEASGISELTFGALLGAVSGYLAGHTMARGRAHDIAHQRGARITDPVPGTRSAATAGSELTLAGLGIDAADECKHFKFVGSTGTGKSSAIAELLGGALARGDRAVIADPDGGYLQRFYDAARGDLILNPFDLRSVKWDLFAEIHHDFDVEQLARSLLPDRDGAERAWRGYARTFFSAVTRQAHAAGVRDLGELYRLLVIADTAELRALTAGTAAQPFLDEHNGRMFDSIRSVTSSAVASLEFIARQQAPALSLRNWVGARERGGVLFLPYRAGQIAALGAAVSAWMRLAIFEAMERPQGDQRLWFVVDELDAIGQIDGLKDALARLRKFGGRCVLGFQSIAQVAGTYGENDAHTIIENCSTTLILRCSASEGGGTSRFASTLIGQREVQRASVSHSRRFGELVGSTTRGTSLQIEPAVLGSEIEQLPDLCGFLKFASRADWLRVRLRPTERTAQSDRTSPYVPAPAPPSQPAPPARPRRARASRGGIRSRGCATPARSAAPGIER